METTKKYVEDKLVSLFIDRPRWEPGVKPDDFLVTIGEKRSNSVYHVAESKRQHKISAVHVLYRYHMKCYRSDLITALQRDKNTQQLIPLKWYKREKKNKS